MKLILFDNLVSLHKQITITMIGVAKKRILSANYNEKIDIYIKEVSEAWDDKETDVLVTSVLANVKKETGYMMLQYQNQGIVRPVTIECNYLGFFPSKIVWQGREITISSAVDADDSFKRRTRLLGSFVNDSKDDAVTGLPFIPMKSHILRRLNTKQDLYLIDSINNANAQILLPVSEFDGVDGSISINKKPNQNLFPYIDDSYKLYAEREEDEVNIKCNENVELKDLTVRDLGESFMFDSSRADTVSFTIKNPINTVSKWIWGDGTFTETTNSNKFITLSHSYAKKGIYYIFQAETTKGGLIQRGEGQDGYMGDVSNKDFANCRTLLMWGCNLLTCNQVFVINATDMSFWSCDFTEQEIENICASVDLAQKDNVILKINGTNAKTNTKALQHIQNIESRGGTVTYNS